MRYLLFIDLDTQAAEGGTPVVGALQVPPCFRPTETFESICRWLGFGVLLADEGTLSASPPPNVLANGQTILDDVEAARSVLN